MSGKPQKTDKSFKPDNYLTIKTPGEGLYKEKGSKFFSYAMHVRTEDEIEAALKGLKTPHSQARHHCYAWRLQANGEAVRANDDGEPANSAGMPILGQLEQFKVTCALVCVVRYFGGTKLGVGGLIQAYKTSAKRALEDARLVRRYVTQRLLLKCDYDHVGELLAFLGQQQIPYRPPEFTTECRVSISVRLSKLEGFEKKLNALHWLEFKQIQ